MTIQELIKKYPNSYELGEAVRRLYDEPKITFLSEDRKSYISIEDKFEEIKKQQDIFAKLEDTTRKKSEDYEILSIKHEGFIYTRENLPVYDKIIEGSMRFLVNNNWTIYSVKRLSDGEIFSNGDIIELLIDDRNIVKAKIVKFDIHEILDKNRLRVECSYVKGTFCVNLNDINHGEHYRLNKKLFTTYDGVDISEGEEYWYIVENNPFIDKNIPLKGIARDSNPNVSEVQKFLGSKCFSTEEKAKEYARMNTIKYSLKDVQDAYKKLLGNGQVPYYRTPNIDEILSSLDKINSSDKEEDFTIVSFLGNKGEHYIRNEKGTYNGGVGLCRNKLTLKYFEDNKIPVYSIKRNSDGVIFTIGDYVKFPTIKGYITAITENYIAINDVTTRIANVSHATPKARTFDEE